jgi:dephospho-CoA kinase
LSRDVTEPGKPAYREIVATFGDTVLLPDGRIDRPALGRRVFTDPDARRRLESITHGAIAVASADAFSRLGAAGHALVVYEAALLVETGRHTTFPALIVVTAPRDVQLARLLARNPELSPGDAEARIASQMPLEQKAAVATHLIVNDGDLEALERDVTRLADDLRDRFHVGAAARVNDDMTGRGDAARSGGPR